MAFYNQYNAQPQSPPIVGGGQQMYADPAGRPFPPQQPAAVQTFYGAPQLQPQSHGPGQQFPQYGGGYTAEGTSMPPPNVAMGPMSVNPMQQQQMYQAQLRNNQQSPAPGFPPQSQASFIPSSAGAYRPQNTPPVPSPTRSTPIQQPPMAASVPNAHPAQLQQAAHLQNQQPPSQNPRPQLTPPQKPILQPPLSPASAKLEAQRVSALLDINRALLQEVVLLQQAGRAGPPQQQQQGEQASGEAEGEKKEEGGTGKTTISSREYLECMRRLQANLSYLATIVDRPHKPLNLIPASPQIMDPPPPVPGNTISEESMQGLREMYKNLRTLYPDLKKDGAGGGAGAQGVGNGNGVPRQGEQKTPG